MALIVDLPGLDTQGRVCRPLPCCSCKTDLQNTSSTQDCPTCNTPVLQSIYTRISPLDEQGCLKTDINCSNCQYNLRTMHYGSTCPECGSSVSQTLRQNRLLMADHQWLNQIRNGFLMIFIGLILMLPTVIIPFAVFITLILVYLGVLRLSKPDPYVDQPSCNQKICRWLKRSCLSLLAIPLLWLVGGLIYLAQGANVTPKIPVALFDVLNMAIGVCFFACFAIAAILFFQRCLIFTDYMDHPSLRKNLKFARGLFVCYLCVVTALQIFNSPIIPNDMMSIFLIIVIVCLGLGNFVALCGVSYRLYRQFDKLKINIQSNIKSRNTPSLNQCDKLTDKS